MKKNVYFSKEEGGKGRAVLRFAFEDSGIEEDCNGKVLLLSLAKNVVNSKEPSLRSTMASIMVFSGQQGALFSCEGVAVCAVLAPGDPSPVCAALATSTSPGSARRHL